MLYHIKVISDWHGTIDQPEEMLQDLILDLWNFWGNQQPNNEHIRETSIEYQRTNKGIN
jgi:hypothetical protein